MPRDTAHAGYVIRKPRPCCFIWSSRASYFRSTLPMLGAITTKSVCLLEAVFQSTLPVWRAMRMSRNSTGGSPFQSTLTRAGSDQSCFCTALSVMDFDPRSPYGKRFSQKIKGIFEHDNFNSRPVLGTMCPAEAFPSRIYFNPCSPCKER